MKKEIIIKVYSLITTGILIMFPSFSSKSIAQKSSETVTDIDGNVYNTVVIGTQVWMKENLKTTKYNDGTPIPNVAGPIIKWSNLTTGAYCWYDNDSNAYAIPYGALYNWYAVNTGKLCPTGWHVPIDAEWHQLVLFLDPDAVIPDPKGTYIESPIAGNKLKETGNTHWQTPNADATNESGFTALPGGCRLMVIGFFASIGEQGYWWSATESGSDDAWSRCLDANYGYIYRSDDRKISGHCVRCIKD